MKKITTILFLFSFITHIGFSQTTLTTGDIAFVGYNGDFSSGSDDFSFILLKNITINTTITFTDKGWLASGGFRVDGLADCNSENTIIWTAGSALTIGKIVTIKGFNAKVDGATNGSVSPSPGACPALNFTSSGESLFAYQGVTPTVGNETNFLAAINMNGGAWGSNSTSTSTSAKPTVFTDGTNSLTISPENDNAVYKGSLSGSVATLRANVNNQTNWVKNNITPYTLPADIGAANATPAIGGTTSGQTINDTATLSPFSAITTTDADGDNLSATITLDNNAKGVITGASSGSGPYTITSRTPAAMQTALRALVFNPTDNRAATSETTTFTVVINDGTVDATNNATTVISSAVAPTVTSINSSTANGTYKAGDNVNVNVTFSENVTVSGTPQITLETGSTDRTINYNGTGSGTNTIQFTYTVQAGDLSADLDYVATNSLTAGTSIRDSGNKDAILTLPTPGAANSLGANKAIVIDGLSPTIISVNSSTINGTYKVGDNINVNVTFSEAVTVAGTPQITLETGTTDRTINYNGTGSGTNTLQFNYTVQAGDETNDLDYLATNSLTAGTSIQDAAGNNATLTLPTPGAANSLGNNKALVIDAVLPTLSSNSPTDGDTSIGKSSNITLTFNEDIAFGTGNIQVIDVTDGSNSFTINAASPGAQASISGAVLTINPSTDLDFNSNYAIQIAATAIDDTAGNSFAGITNNTVLDFTTEATSGTGTHLNFDGSNDIVDIGSSMNTILDGINTFTVEANVRPTTNTGNGVIVGNYDYPTTGLGMQFLLRRDGSNYTFWIDHGTGFKNVTATSAVTLNTWQHVAGTWDGTNMRIYVDGVLQNTTAETGASFKTLTTTKVAIGGNAHAEKFTGDIDEVRIWSKVRTVGEISANKDIEISNTETGLLAYYQFNQGTGESNNSGVTKLTDNSVNNNTGTLSNFALSGITSNWLSPSLTWTGSVSNDWNTAGNWNKGVLVNNKSNITIPSGLTSYPTITGAVTINSIIINSGASLIAKDATSFTGTVTYNRNVNFVSGNLKGWYLMSSPVVGETYNDTYVTANSIANSGTNRGIATYNTATNTWSYLQGGGSRTFNDGQGYSIKRKTSTGNVNFTGTLNTNNAGVNRVMTTTSTRFNLIGNPYTTYLNSVTFLNNEGAISDTKTLWVWNRTLSTNGAYEVKGVGDAFVIAPGQGFFVQANAAGGTFNFAESNQSHNGADTFQRDTKNEFKLIISDGTINNYAKVYYLNNTTTGFDVGYDGEMFSGTSNSFAVYTHLITDSQGKNYQIQSLPKANYENMVIPVGLNVEAGKEITFSVEDLNLPTDIKVFLEDKETNTFTRLDEANSNFKFTPTSALNGIGRFFIHTSQNALSIKDVALDNVSIYKLDNSTLRVAGLQNIKTNIKVFNILGKLVLNTSFTSNGVKDVTLPKLATGVYVVQLQTDKGKLNKKIILE